MRSGEPCSAPADRRKSCVDSMPSCPSNLMVLPRLSPETIPSPHVSDRGSLPEQISTRPTVVSPPTYGDDSPRTYLLTSVIKARPLPSSVLSCTPSQVV